MSPNFQYFILKETVSIGLRQKRTQNGNIYSMELDVYAVKQSTSNLSFIFPKLKQGRKTFSLYTFDID